MVHLGCGSRLTSPLTRTGPSGQIGRAHAPRLLRLGPRFRKFPLDGSQGSASRAERFLAGSSASPGSTSRPASGGAWQGFSKEGSWVRTPAQDPRLNC